jgi:uncharacterized Tic20 family protein
MSQDSPQELPSQDERITAALAHVTILVPFWGIIAAIVIWATQKDKSRFAAFQALQAITYHLTYFIAQMILMALYMCSFFTFIPLAVMAGGENGEIDSPIALLFFPGIPFCIFPLFFVLVLAFIGYGLYAAWSALQGRDFRYAVIGNRLERYLARGKDEAPTE